MPVSMCGVDTEFVPDPVRTASTRGCGTEEFELVAGVAKSDIGLSIRHEAQGGRSGGVRFKRCKSIGSGIDQSG